MRVEQFSIPLVRFIANRRRLAEALLGRSAWGNPFSVEAYADPYPAFELMRADGPVAYNRMYQQWFVTGYDEAKAIMVSPNAGVAAQVETFLDVRPYSKLSPRSQQFFATWLLLVDPPRHTRLRRLVSSTFTPRQVARLEPVLVDIAEELLDAFDARTDRDLAEGFTVPLPIYAISELLGVPADRRAWIHDIAVRLIVLLEPFQGFAPHDVDAAVDELHDYVVELAAQRRAEPRDDLITALAQAESDGDRLDEDELVAMVGFLLFAGYETTSGVLGNALVALANHPAETAKLQADAELWPNAVEEFLRFDTGVKADPRFAIDDIELDGVTIPKGANIVLMLAGANRDPRRYAEPDQLMVDRVDPNPISFGHGIHHCIGASLARLEIRIGLQSLLARHDPADLDLAATEWKQSLTLRGPSSLPLRSS